MEQQTIQATVNPRLLSKASRLFAGSLEGRIIEILQNARRAGATEVEITNKNGFVTISDNGRGIDDFAQLLDLGRSGWEDDLEASEDPAGVGLFCLAPREVTIRSHGKRVTITREGWTGTPVAVHRNPHPVQGTHLRFQDEAWSASIVKSLAVFTGMRVVVDDEPCPQERFIPGRSAHHAELGCRVKVVKSSQLTSWHQPAHMSTCTGTTCW